MIHLAYDVLRSYWASEDFLFFHLAHNRRLVWASGARTCLNWSTRVFLVTLYFVFVIGPPVSGVWTLILYTMYTNAMSLFFLASIVVGWWYFSQIDWTLILYPIWPQLWRWAKGGKRVVETMTSQLSNAVPAIRILTLIPNQSPQEGQKLCFYIDVIESLQN